MCRIASAQKLRFWTGTTYEQSWLDRAGSRPISLSLPLSASRYSGDRVYNFFDNLLPDNPAIRHKIQSRFQLDTAHAFDLLAAVGNDCVGAIQLSTTTPGDVQKMNYQLLSEAAVARLLAGYQDAPLEHRSV